MEKGPPSNQSADFDGAADILLVEDDPGDVELALAALKTCNINHQVEQVSDGADALEYIAAVGLQPGKQAASLPKLILLDLNLRNVGGLQVLRQLKSDERTKGIPIVVLTSSRLAIEMVESYKLGVNSYVIKPNGAKKFMKAVTDIAHYWLAVNEPPPF